MRSFGTDSIHNDGFKDHNACNAHRTSGTIRALTERIVLPLPPSLGDDSKFEMEVYARFMRHLREVPNSRMEIKIFSAIQFTADMMDHGDALIAKLLVDMGLRAPRKAFPITFLDFADKASTRTIWNGGSIPPSVSALKEHWHQIGEDRFASPPKGRFAVGDNVRSIV